MTFLCNARFVTKQMISPLRTLTFARSMSCGPKLVIKEYKPLPDEHHDIKNMKLNRPMSPHLTIYRPQLTSVFSLTHRATGIVATAYVVALGTGALLMPHDMSCTVDMIESMHLPFALFFVLKFGLAWPFAYHTCNGIRHLIWDTANALTNKEVATTGYAALAASVVLAGAILAL